MSESEQPKVAAASIVQCGLPMRKELDFEVNPKILGVTTSACCGQPYVKDQYPVCSKCGLTDF